jgi:hypothetical protein
MLPTAGPTLARSFMGIRNYGQLVLKRSSQDN